MKTLSMIIVIIIMIIFILSSWISAEKQLDDCRFECNHLQNKLFQLEEFNDYIPAMEQLLTPLQLARLKAVTEMIRQKKHKEYERYEQPVTDN